MAKKKKAPKKKKLVFGGLTGRAERGLKTRKSRLERAIAKAIRGKG